MGFLKDLFKRKPGGTLLGNTLRGVTRSLTGGLLGNGALMISQEEYDRKNGNSQSNPNLEALGNLVKESAMNTPQAEEEKKKAILDMLKKYWYVPAALLSLIVYLIVKASK